MFYSHKTFGKPVTCCDPGVTILPDKVVDLAEETSWQDAEGTSWPVTGAYGEALDKARS